MWPQTEDAALHHPKSVAPHLVPAGSGFLLTGRTSPSAACCLRDLMRNSVDYLSFALFARGCSSGKGRFTFPMKQLLLAVLSVQGNMMLRYGEPLVPMSRTKLPTLPAHRASASRLLLVYLCHHLVQKFLPALRVRQGALLLTDLKSGQGHP